MKRKKKYSISLIQYSFTQWIGSWWYFINWSKDSGADGSHPCCSNQCQMRKSWWFFVDNFKWIRLNLLNPSRFWRKIWRVMVFIECTPSLQLFLVWVCFFHNNQHRHWIGLNKLKISSYFFNLSMSRNDIFFIFVERFDDNPNCV